MFTPLDIHICAWWFRKTIESNKLPIKLQAGSIKAASYIENNKFTHQFSTTSCLRFRRVFSIYLFDTTWNDPISQSRDVCNPLCAGWKYNFEISYTKYIRHDWITCMCVLKSGDGRLCVLDHLFIARICALSHIHVYQSAAPITIN